MSILSEIIKTVQERHEYLYELLIQHILLSLAAIVIITGIGLATGIGILYKPKFRSPILGTVNFLYTIPSIAMFGLFIPLIGIGYGNALVVLIIYGLLPVIRNTYTGLNEVDPLLLDAAKGMGATPWQIFSRIRWPLAFPTILSGFRTMVVMTIALAGLASFIGAGGLGQAIYRGINTNNSSLILVGSIAVALLALAADLGIGAIEKSLKTKAKKQNKKSRFLKYFGLGIFALLFIFMLLSKPGNSSGKKIVVATKPTAEQYILGEIISQLIENKTDIQVVRKFGIGGGTSNIHPAMLKGEIDIYPEYTGTAWLFVLKKPQINHPDSLFSALKAEYAKQFNFDWVCRLGFNNTFTLALPEAVAQNKNINTFSELAHQSNSFIFGAEFDFFEREDGFIGLNKIYPFNFKNKVELDVNLKFQALENHTVDVINAFSTDSRIRQMKLRVLKDDKLFFPAYQAGIVIRNETQQKYPELNGLFSRLEGLINDTAMLQMNYEVEIEKKSPGEVALTFLKANGLIN
ncbi:ABC transporter permease/substrate-binding protein [Prolixibacter sp. NT017]|uniref:ABC transporter permease/substrate-binding protein n=1 Tax=Prolixibacter sp. NT017 TaxID=2652390 RepID=UPI001277F868|nr:ABC transporter permease/substrate-binding protein [Prolixibacter sp. NT017]GET24414.1 glycine/betaine ABC transporter substrate-binding protein [Prolixibacter sp. NT017]